VNDNSTRINSPNVEAENSAINYGESGHATAGHEVSAAAAAPTERKPPSRLELSLKILSLLAAVLFVVLGAVGAMPWKYAGLLAFVLIAGPGAVEGYERFMRPG